MGNGYSVEKMIELILDGQKETQAEIKTLHQKIDAVSLNGCAHRSDDLERIKKLEDWKTRGIIGFIGMSVTIIYEMVIKGGK